MRDQMLQEFREKKEREVAELVAIKSDLELRLQRAGEEGEQGDGSGSHLVGETCTPATPLSPKFSKLMRKFRSTKDELGVSPVLGIT